MIDSISKFSLAVQELIGTLSGISDDDRRTAREKIENFRKEFERSSDLVAKISEQAATLAEQNARISEGNAKLAALGAKNVQGDVASNHWLAVVWRPLVMLTFATLIVLHWLGVTPDDLPESQVLEMMEIVKIGLGGYVIGRSVEKTLPVAVRVLNKGK